MERDLNGDVLLRKIVALADKMDETTEGRARIEITLAVGGFLVSGHIISEREFLLFHPLTDKMLEAYDSLAKNEGVSLQDVVNELPEFIHLSGTCFFVPGHPPIPTRDDPNGLLWRGRISEVAGFSFGRLAVEDS